MELELLELKDGDLEYMPLFFRKIYHNKITDINVENKLMKYSKELQTTTMRSEFSLREISKTVDHNIFQNDD